MRPYLRPLFPLALVSAAGYWAMLFYFTHVPTVDLPDIDYIDKACHFGAYAVLSFLIGSVAILWRGYQPRLPIWILTLSVAYGAIDEYTQTFVPGRTADLLDLVADSLGAGFGLLALHVCVVVGRPYRTKSLQGNGDLPSGPSDDKPYADLATATAEAAE